MIEEVEVQQGNTLADYEAYAHLARPVDELRREAEPLVKALGGRRVWMVNSTAKGGGVAEMLPRQIALLRELGLQAHWLVIGTERTAFFDLTKRLHNAIHGAGEGGFSAEDRALYDKVGEELAAEIAPRMAPGDVLVVHDPQPAAMGARIRQTHDVIAVWRCHIGLDEENTQTQAAWRLLESSLREYDHGIFTAPEYIPTFMAGHASLITPAIDPLTDKNRPLSAHRLTGVLCNSGLALEHSPVLPGPFACQAERLRPDGSFGPAADPDEIGLLYRPIVTQISRWDRLKGWKPLLDAFAQLKLQYTGLDELSDVQRRRFSLCRLVFAGPEPAAVADDPEAKDVLDELIASYRALPAAVQKDVVLLSLPMGSTRENALMVNALQSCSSIVVQNSVREGFGLTVTEPMYKGVPVLGSPACGIRQQIRDGIDGRLHHDAADPAVIATALVEMLNDPAGRATWGRTGQRRAYDEFLIFSQLRSWLRVLSAAVDRGSFAPPRPSKFPPSSR
ncbi:MAG: glycosyltransferase [Polyangiaceae bacterium]